MTFIYKYPEHIIDRFWSYVNKQEGEDSCWLWIGSLNSNGYGKIRVSGRMTIAHRFAYSITYGAIGDLSVCHHCDVKPCVRPTHLFLGTQRENIQDAIEKGRFNSVGKNNGRAILTEENVREIRSRLRLGDTHRQLARRFKVTKSAITRINIGQAWKELS